MTVPDLLRLLGECPIVASVQASEGSPLDDPQTLLKLAQASIQSGVRVLRLQGVENIRTIQPATGLPVMGLIKRHYPDSHSYITPTLQEVDELLGTDCEIVGIDAVIRKRPKGGTFEELVERVHRAGRLVLADIDEPVAAMRAVEAGADMVSSTLHGYTESTMPTPTGPGLEALRGVCAAVDVPVFAEGRYAQEWEIKAALRIGAVGVVMGSALNDALKQTERFVRVTRRAVGPVGAVDIGGTWLRFATFSGDWEILSREQIRLPQTGAERLAWIRAQAEAAGVNIIGLSSGGTIDPRSGQVLHAKAIIPDHDIAFNEGTLGKKTYALNDGLATAWAHACHPLYAGMRIACLTLGTGVGFGFAERDWLWTAGGEPTKLNDLPFEDTTIEGALGGASFEKEPTEVQRERAARAFQGAIGFIRGAYFPDRIIVAGGVGLSPWMEPEVKKAVGVDRSPFGADAGLYGAAALALFPPTAL